MVTRGPRATRSRADPLCSYEPRPACAAALYPQLPPGMAVYSSLLVGH
jgi:hypothetical protein